MSNAQCSPAWLCSHVVKGMGLLQGDTEWFETDDSCAHLDSLWNASNPYADIYLVGRIAGNARESPSH
eukprot:4758063-Amphidinium_carterae.1